MQDFHYVRPDEMWSLDGAVSGGADTSYLDDWLVDGRPGRPVRATSGSPSWTVTNPSKDVGLIAVCNHNVDAGRTINITGGLTTSLTGPTLPASGIPLNPWVSVSETSVSTLTLAISSNSVPVFIGEFVAGKKRTLERSLIKEARFEQVYQTVRHGAEFDSLMPHDKGLVSRRLNGMLLLTSSGFDDVQAWVDSTRGGSRQTLIVPDTAKQDAWLVEIVEFSYVRQAALYRVSIAFQEYPRSRW